MGIKRGFSRRERKRERRRVFEHRALKKIFCPKGIQLHDRNLHGLYSTPNNTRVIKLSIMRWVGHVEDTVRRKIHTWFLWGNMESELVRSRRT